MCYSGVVFCSIMIVIGIATERKKINPITVFYTLWLLIFQLSDLRFYNLKETSDRTYLIILYGLISYGIGYYVIRILFRKYSYNIKLKKIQNRNIKKQFFLKYRLLYILSVICILVYLYDLSTIFSYIINGNSLGYIRALVQDSNSFIYTNRSAIENAIRLLIVTPFALALQPIVAADFWIGSRDKKLLVMNIIMIFLRVVTDGSRALILYFLFHLIVISFFSDKKWSKAKTKLNKKNKLNKFIVIVSIVVIGIFALYKTTLSRSGENFIRYLYYYFSMEPYMFQTWTEIVDNTNIIGYGLASLNGFIFTIFYVLKNFLMFPKYPEYWYSIYNFILSTDSNWHVIAGDATIANAYVSLFFFFYLDGKILGVIVGAFLYGVFSARVFINALNRRDTKSICIYSIILQGISFSFVRFQFADIYYALAVFFIIFIVYKPSRILLNNNK